MEEQRCHVTSPAKCCPPGVRRWKKKKRLRRAKPRNCGGVSGPQCCVCVAIEGVGRGDAVSTRPRYATRAAAEWRKGCVRAGAIPTAVKRQRRDLRYFCLGQLWHATAFRRLSARFPTARHCRARRFTRALHQISRPALFSFREAGAADAACRSALLV